MKSQTVSINKRKKLVTGFACRSTTEGFTLVEIMVIVAIVTIVFSIGAFANVRLFTREISISEESILVGVLQKARSRAMNNIDASPHGVHIEDGSDYYVVYREFPYNASNATNEKFWRENKVAVTADLGSEIIFEQLSGNTANDGTITLVDTGGYTKDVEILQNGLINW